MNVEDFREKEEIDINGTKFMISLLPATVGKEVFGDIVRATDGMGDIGLTCLPLHVSAKLLAYAAFYDENSWFTLEEAYRMDKACKTPWDLIDLETRMIKKNFGFLTDGSLQKRLGVLNPKRLVTSRQK